MSGEGPVSKPDGQELTCSIIGSFRKHYAEVAILIETLEACHVHVLSPKRSSIVNPKEWFVRLQTDNPRFEPVEIQPIAVTASAIINPERIVQYLVQHKSPPPIVATEIPEHVRELQDRLKREEFVE